MSDVAVSIGTVARLTGIPVETLRTWERRYDFPSPQRTAGGHRLYNPETVELLQLVAKAIANGHRASTVVGRSRDEVVALLERDAASSSASPLPEVMQPDFHSPPVVTDIPLDPVADAEAAAARLGEWVEAIRNMDADTLDHGFLADWSRLGTLPFITARLAPLLDEVGNAWASGRITVSQEHFGGERARHFLLNIWRPLAEHNQGRPVLLSTLPGEMHDLGLHMAACVAAEVGLQVLYLGASTPIADIVSAARQKKVAAVLVSVSRSFPLDDARSMIRSLRANLPDAHRLAVGGAGAPDDIDGVEQFATLPAFRSWLASELPQS